MLWLIDQFFNFFLQIFLIEKIQLMIEKYFQEFILQQILTKVDKEALIE